MEENKNLDRFIRKSIKQVGLEEPSVDFTDVVLSKIEKNSAAQQTIVYKSMISKPMWFVILSTIVLVFGYVFFTNASIENTWLSILQLNQLTTFNLSGRIPNIALSNTYSYSILIFIFFAILQVFMIVRRINKHYSLI